MRQQRSSKSAGVWGYVIFFLLIAATVTVAFAIFGLVDRLSGGDKGTIAVTMLCVILALSGICTLIDAYRRKIMVDRPVKKILSAAERISAGDFSVRLEIAHPYEKYDEYDLIMENLNVMAAELGKSEMLKTDFISNVSHELKTPLAVIANYVSALRRDDLDSEMREKYAKTVLQAVRRLSDLISNILKLGKLENREIKPEKEKIKLHEMLAEVILQYEDIIDEKGITLNCDLDETEITSSPGNLEIVWSNLLSNAVKFTENGGRIDVSLRRDGENVTVKVADTGCGISPEIGARIFDKFYQGDTSHSQEGNGLGLALVKRVIDILGGEIAVISEPGHGSTFTITLKGN